MYRPIRLNTSTWRRRRMSFSFLQCHMDIRRTRLGDGYKRMWRFVLYYGRGRLASAACARGIDTFHCCVGVHTVQMPSWYHVESICREGTA